MLGSKQYNMATINNILFTDYGLHISTSKGVANLPEAKEQFFNVFGKAGYQLTKRRANTLEINAFIIADDLADFIQKTSDLRTLFSDPGIKVINLGDNDVDCFATEGFRVSKVFKVGAVYSKFYIKLNIV